MLLGAYYYYQLPELDVLEVIDYKMKENGIKAKDLVSIIGSKGHISRILSEKREITLKTAQKLIQYSRRSFLQGA